MIAGSEKTASRAAPANTQQRASSVGRSMNTQSRIGFFRARDSRRPSSRQLFHAISRQATRGALSESIRAFSDSGVGGLVGGAAAWVQARPAHSSAAAAIG